MNFEQRNITQKVQYNILHNGVKKNYKSISNKLEKVIKFEDIGTEIIKSSKRKVGWLIASIICLIFSIIMLIPPIIDESIENALIYFVIFGICFTIYLSTKEDLIYLQGNDSIFFFNKKSNTEKINEYLNMIIERRNSYLKEKYFKIEIEMMAENQIQKFKWLLNENVINQEEYNRISQELLNDGLSKNKLGFIND